MRQLWTLPVLSLACTTFIFITDRSAVAAILFQSNLTGDQEVPNPVNTSGMGFATLELSGSPGSWILNYELTYSDLLGVVASPFAHIHNAPFGENGPIVHDLDNANEPPIAGSSAGTILGDWRFDDPEDPLTDALARELQNGNLYFNIHTSSFPGGEIRGQIEQVTVASVPEPGTLMGLALLGGVGLIPQKRKSRNSA